MSELVTVVGAGVIGLCSAIRLAEAGCGVTVRAEEIPGRTSLTAAALWGQYMVGPVDRVSRWSETTRKVLGSLAERQGTGVRLLSGVEASRRPGFANPLPDLPGVRPAEAAELPEGFASGWHYTIPVLDMPAYLDYLLAWCRELGVRIEWERVESLSEVEGDVVVNCTGIQALELVDDPQLRPIRGQLLVLSNPGITDFFLEDAGGRAEFTHYLPHGDQVIAGGIAVEGDTDLEPDPAVAQAIHDRVARIAPELAGAEVVGHRVALRPARAEVRLEREPGTRLIHNYGHGGAGISLSWGCAAEVVRLTVGSSLGA